MQSKSILAAVSFVLAPSIHAQELFAGFDSMVEGTFATSFSEGGITITNLDEAIPTGGPYFFVIEEAWASIGGPGFTPQNAVGFHRFTPGGYASWGRCKSFDIEWGGPLATDARVEVWIREFGFTVGNGCTLEASLGGSVVSTDFLSTGSGGLAQASLHVSAPAFDHLRIIGSGSTQEGAFYALIDSIRLSLNSPPDEFCYGDGSGTACPCGNSSPFGQEEGCLNSLGIGARLRMTGTVSIADDSVVLAGSQMPNATALYFQGTTQVNGGAGTSFGDGLRCAGGTNVRLGTKTNVAGASQYPGVGDPSVSARGLVTSPGIRTYQVWYRNAAGFCTSATFNLTNGIQIHWVS